MTAEQLRRMDWIRGLGGATVGVAAGYFCSRLHTPIPWMLGPLLSMAVLRMAGAPLGALPGGRQFGQWIIGTALGLYFTPQVIGHVAGWWFLLLAGAAFAVAAGYIGGLVLSRLAGIDRTTAIFASVPGGASEMAVLGERFGARVDRVAAAQSLRILIVVVVVPFAFAWLGVHGSDGYAAGLREVEPGGLAVLLSATFAGGWVGQRLGLANAFILGSLAVAIPITGAGISLSAMPTPLSNAAQCLLGCALGSRFEPEFVRGAPRFIAAVSATVLGAIATTGAVAWLLAAASGLSVYTLALGLAPGGIAEMCITAKLLELGVPLVTAFHVTRVVVLLLFTAPLFDLVRRWRERGRRAGGG